LVLAKNPWLAGEISKGGDDGSKNYLQYYGSGCAYSKEETIYRIFHFLPSASLITRRTPSQELGKILAAKGLIVKFGHDDTKPLFLISIVEIKDEDEFAIITSMSHVLGDGHTFHAIYNMLVSGKQISECVLDPERIDLAMKQHEETFGKTEARLLSSAGFILLPQYEEY
jgi:hypothetical protein